MQELIKKVARHSRRKFLSLNNCCIDNYLRRKLIGYKIFLLNKQNNNVEYKQLVLMVYLMPEIKTNVRIGTSGWYYNHWHGLFYPKTIAKHKWFEHYSKQFDTVEINSSYYHFPKPENVRKWYKSGPEDFIYAVKANRYITHLKKLRNVESQLTDFLQTVSILKEKLGPVLFQLPPSLHRDFSLLKDFLSLLDDKTASVFEFRHKSWYEDKCFSLLDDFNAGLCMHDMAGSQTPRVVTGNMIYIRFHGTSGKYAGSYDKKTLAGWAGWIKKNKKAKDCFVYFNNDYKAYAVKNAKTLIKMLTG